ncbi:Tetratricopeptide repeat-containing protein [Chitinophaga sp. YR573]|uniref:tetratricopeptide repeat protein n=1 Tax=Chitinophaga sp. YR573 TaxID=1881040 RepID=UPI0008AA8D35|nr:tetratricopeptide repeat protein [Chitinophaga sp. YR573]SEW44144.1 Tetratricopeptide repeat-containing protein [Chitinophaga sp. YR573]
MEEINQLHSGTGDNIGRDKITIILGKSVEYNSLKSRIDELQEDLGETTNPERRLKKSELLNEATDQLKQFKEGVIQLAEIFTKIEINTERLRIAKEHFEAGRLREADAILKAEELAIDQIALLTAKESKHQELQDIDEKLNNNANEYLVKARLRALHYDSNDRIIKTCEYFELALKSSRLNGVVFEYALFLQGHNIFDKATLLYEELLNYYKKMDQNNPQNYKEYIANTLNNLGVLYRIKNDFERSEIVYKEALEIRMRLAQTNPKKYEPYVASTMNNLGVLYKNKNDFEDAEVVFNRALDIYRRLAETTPQPYEPDIAMIQNNLGVLYKIRNNFEDAEVAVNEALEIYRRLTTTNPQTYESYVALTQNNLGILYKVKNDFEHAEVAYNEALKIYRKLVSINPQTYEQDIAMVQNNRANLYTDKNNFEDAEVAYNEALEIYRRLSCANELTYESYVANTLNNLGVFYNARKDFKQAEIVYRNAIEIYEKLAKSRPQPFELELARSSYNHGLALKNNDQIKLAYDRILIARNIAEKYPNIPLAQQIADGVNELLVEMNTE